MRKFRVVAVAIVVFAQTICGTAFANVQGNLICDSDSCSLVQLRLTGDIDKRALAAFESLIAEVYAAAEKQNKNVALIGNKLTLDSPGGSVEAAISIGRIMRRERMNAFVAPGNVCISACVFIYAGAVGRFGSNRLAKIGIHQPFFDFSRTSMSDREVRDKYEAMLRQMRDYFREMNVSERLAEEMMKIPPAAVRVLSAQEQEDFGLAIVDPVEREVSSVAEARRLNISRSEYIRRQSVSMKICTYSKNANCHRDVMKTGLDSTALDLSEFGTPVK